MDENTSDLHSLLWRVDAFITDSDCRKLAAEVVRRYKELEPKIGTDCSVSVAEGLGWMAEYTKSPEVVRVVGNCLLLQSVFDTLGKYRGDVADEILTSIKSEAEASRSTSGVEHYVSWINSGLMANLLGIASGLDNNGGLKLKKNIFSLLTLGGEKIEAFNGYASAIDKRKVSLDKKLELLNLIKVLAGMEKEEHIETLIRLGAKGLAERVQKDLGGIHLESDFSSLMYGIKFMKDRKADPNLDFLAEKNRAYRSIPQWLEEDPVTKQVMKDIQDAGIKADFFVSSGKAVGSLTPKNARLEKWEEFFALLSKKILGSRRNNILPSVSIAHFSPRKIFHKIKPHYLEAMAGNKDAALKVLQIYSDIIYAAYKDGKLHLPVRMLIKELDDLSNMIRHGGVLNHRGSRVTAKVWKRRVPYDFYDSEILRCCIYLPNGEMKEEIPLLMMDPKTTLVQYFIKGISVPVACSSFYAGMAEGKPALLLDTWDAGGLVYVALGHDKMKQFVLETLRKFGKKAGADVVVFSKGEYGRPEEFCNYLKLKKHEAQVVNFKSVDAGDRVLEAYSQTKKRHYTDAYGLNRMEGPIAVYKI